MRFINFLTYSTVYIIASFVLMSFSTTAMAGIFDFGGNQDNIAPHEKTIGAMIPLTGKHKNLGEMISRSVTMAWYDYAPKDLKLNIYDTQSSREGAISGYEKASINNAKIIVGPLTGDNTKTIANYNRGSIINLSLTNNPAYGQSNIMIMGYTPQSQGIAISKILEYKDFNRAVILVPDNKFGNAVIEGIGFFGGNRIVHTVYYPPNAEDFKDLAKYLVKNKSYYDYDAIILSDGNPKTIRILAAQLAYYDAQDPHIDLQDTSSIQKKIQIPMIGGLGWYALNGAYKEPPLLNGYYIRIPNTPRKAVFDEKYKELYGKKPTPLARLAYDIMALSIVTTNHDDPIKKLTQKHGFSGISGIFKISDYGMVTRDYHIMKVRRTKSVYASTVSVQNQ